MNKKLFLFVFSLLALLSILAPFPALAAGPRVISSSVQVTFPTTLTFKISAQSDANISDIRLQYQVQQFSFAQVTAEGFVELNPAKDVQSSWTWDLRRSGGLPPGTKIKYWWLITDTAGTVFKSELATVSFDDTRYKWRQLTQGKITLYWYTGDDAFAAKLMAASQQAVDRMLKDAGAQLEQPVTLYIYGNSNDLRGSMIFPQDWTGGVAFTEYNAIAIGIATNQLDWGMGAIAHELTHLLVRQMTANPYNDLPTWLNEGLAMYAEGSLDPSYVNLVNLATKQNQLISVRSLVSPFSAYGDQSALAYGESYRLIEFLVSKYGQPKMTELLGVFKKGSDYDPAFIKVYGFDMDGLNNLWRKELGLPPAPTTGPLIIPQVTIIASPTPTSPVTGAPPTSLPPAPPATATATATTTPITPASATPSPPASQTSSGDRPGPLMIVIIVVFVLALLAGIYVMARKWVWKSKT